MAIHDIKIPFHPKKKKYLPERHNYYGRFDDRQMPYTLEPTQFVEEIEKPSR